MELAKAYEPKVVEGRWYSEWLARDAFRATPGSGRPYCITIPPPNVTGSLHIGHALNAAVLDTMTRWRRMAGDNVLCLPGTDHAGIATQNVVERDLAAQGLTRHDLGRERFVERCWEWRRQYGDRIYLQLQKLGCSYDWSRARFTMDPSYVEAIHEAFLRWWKRGLIYRGKRVVNWCPRCRSAISDIEVSSEERPGKLYHMRYPFANGSGFITIATTRPETMLGDTAVAVNPEDARYAGAVGTKVRLPLTDREIPVIADEYARMDFGSGAVKVTPAHDLDDFEAGLRHRLPQVVVIGEDGAMTLAAGPRYAGMERFDCRRLVLEDMAAQGLLGDAEDYVVKTPLCDRCKTVLEPLLSEQWFARQTELAAPAIDVVRAGDVRFWPDRYARIYLDWMGNIRDWCISRQLWWGHRIPVWWTLDGRYAAARSGAEAAAELGVPEADLRQDEDVLDTWFSSALWPIATLGWPAETEDLAFWYPTNVLSTAQEILFLWVARMVMTGLDFVGQVPFRDVYVHATILDERGERMSKSKGNGVDPLDMVERYGADALRFSLLQQAGKNQDIRFSEERVRLAGTFCNKLWNASRFVLLSLEGKGGGLRELPADEALTTPDRWILSRLNRTIDAVTSALATYDMDDAMRAAYAFLWDELCDWYLEIVKPRLRSDDADAGVARRVLWHALDSTLRLMHPMVPFITEEIWQALENADPTGRTRETILRAPYPQADPTRIAEAPEERMGIVMASVRALRNARAEAGVAPAARVLAAAVPGSRRVAMALTEANELIVNLARLSELQMHDAPPGGAWVGAAIDGAELFVDVGLTIDVDKERERLGREVASVERDLARGRAKLANEQFVSRAPEAVVQRERASLAGLEERLASLAERRARLER
ncbi:MAG: valine--tRNA ligase [Chthonomonadales bacterium]|nr:valine--tRNA ligase [Chthonomonadales bacterium]